MILTCTYPVLQKKGLKRKFIFKWERYESAGLSLIKHFFTLKRDFIPCVNKKIKSGWIGKNLRIIKSIFLLGFHRYSSRRLYNISAPLIPIHIPWLTMLDTEDKFAHLSRKRGYSYWKERQLNALDRLMRKESMDNKLWFWDLLMWF